MPSVEKVAATQQPAKPPKIEVATDVPVPPKASKPVVESKVKVPAAPAPTPVVEAPPVKVEPPKVEPPKVEIAKVEPAPSAVQFAKAPELPIVAPPVVPVAPPPAPVVVAAPPPVPVAAPAAPQQLAVVTPPVTSSLRKGDNLSVLFASESEHLPDSARSDLEKLAQKLERDEGLTMQLLAYAAGDEANASKARRLSLTRALKVRTYLMELGVRSTRIEVRALGNKIEGGPADRVDVVLGNR